MTIKSEWQKRDNTGCTRLATISLIVMLLGSVTSTHAAEEAAPRGNHIAFYVRDLKVSTDFYSEVIGLPTIPEPFKDGRHTWYLIGPKMHLHIISGATTDLPKIKNNHLCFSVPSVDAFIPRLVKAGVTYENLQGEKGAVTVRPDGVKQIYFQDPDGYWLEINDAKD